MIRYTAKHVIDVLFESPKQGLSANTERIISSGFKPRTRHFLKDGVYVEFIPTVSGVRKQFYYKESRITKERALAMIKRGRIDV